MYGLSIVGYKVELIVKPFAYSNVERVNEIVLLTDGNPLALRTAEEARNQLHNYNVTTSIVKTDEIFDFRKMFLLAKKISMEMGQPEWINVTAGPGIAIAVLVLAFPKSRLIYYSEGPPIRVLSVDVHRLLRAFWNIEKSLPIFDFVREKGEVEFEEIVKAFHCESKATISRKLSSLKDAGLLESKGSGRGRQRKKYFVREKTILPKFPSL